MAIKALIFDQDGVIIDTERDGHRVAFNKGFKAFGYDFQWSVEKYHELLAVSGGKERMQHYLHTDGFGVDLDLDPDAEWEHLKKMHAEKTSIFIEMLESGALPLRPGVHRLMKEANEAGIVLGICTTSNVRSAKAVAYGILKDIEFDFLFAGDMVGKKKPDPEIYQLALKETGLKPEECLVVEDSRNGLLAAVAAGMPVVATTNVYTEEEDLSEAGMIVTCLGDPDGEKGELTAGGEGLDYDGVLTLEQLMGWFG